MIFLWTKSFPSKALTRLAPVLGKHKHIPITVGKDYVPDPAHKVIVAMGKPPLESLQSLSIIPKKRTTTSCRTQIYHYQGIPTIITYNPDIGDVDNNLYVDVLTDVALAVKFHDTGSFKPKMGNYKWVDDFSGVCQRIKDQYEATKQPVDIELDTETLGLHPYTPPRIDYPGSYIIMIQCCIKLEEGEAVYFKNRPDEEQRLAPGSPLRAQLEWLMNCPYIRVKGANFKHDTHFFAVRANLYCTNFTFDTNLVGGLLDENRTNSLDMHVKLYAPRLFGYSDEFDLNVNKERMDLLPKDQKLLDYGCGDVDGGLEVAAEQKRQLLQDNALTAFYVNILHPAGRAFEDLEQTGMLVDKKAYAELKGDLEVEACRLVKEACKILGGKIVAKHGDPEKVGGMNLTKASMLKDFMFSPMGLNLKPKMFTEKPDKNGIQKPATSEEHLLMFEDEPDAVDFIKIFKEYSSVNKTYNTYVVGFLNHLRPDNRFHATYFLYTGDKTEDEGGTVTGRLSAKGPAVQTIPKHTKWAPRIRRCFVPPPGYVITERDYSQGELRVMACLADETNMIAAYKAGRDLHLETSAFFAGYTYESLLALKKTDPHKFKETRQLGKAGNFGLIFKISVEGFMVYAKQNYGVTLSREDATKFHSGFFAKYPRITTFHEFCIAFAKQFKHVRSPLGRIRHLPLINSPSGEHQSKAERQSINSPVQSTLTDMVLWTLALEKAEGLSKISLPFYACHDAAYNYTPEDQVDKILRRQMDIMENLPFKEKFGWSPELKFLTDGTTSDKNMGEMADFHR